MSDATPPALRTDTAGVTVGIVAARYNPRHADLLLERCRGALRAAGLPEAAVEVVRVPGSHEIPWAVQALARTGRHPVLIGLGVLVRGGTSHHEMVGAAVAQALLRVSLDHHVPVINGVLVVESEEQAAERAGPAHDRGAEFARAALEMAALRRQLRAALGRPGGA